jgi:AcrR family transcriptional regulator
MRVLARRDLVTTNTVGRPRDPLLDQRVYAAACDLYGRRGWAGFSIETLAREAGIGKSSIYLRWSDKAALLIDAFRAQLGRPEDVDTGSVRGDLRELALHDLRLYLSPLGDAALRITAEARVVPEIAAHWEGTREAYILAVRAIVRRGIKRGDLPAATSVTLLLDALFGALLMHVVTTPTARMSAFAKSVDDYADEVVDFVLAAVRARSG